MAGFVHERIGGDPLLEAAEQLEDAAGAGHSDAALDLAARLAIALKNSCIDAEGLARGARERADAAVEGTADQEVAVRRPAVVDVRVLDEAPGADGNVG